MTFFLGVHQAAWLERLAVPLCVSRRRLAPRKRLPRALHAWALDCGGYTELALYGRWTVSERQYIGEVRRFATEIGGLQWAPALDWMCEPAILRQTNLSVSEHQARTLASYERLRFAAPDLPWIPVLQGWTVDDYQRHADRYEAAGIDLGRLPLVGLGSVCRRQGTREVEAIIRSLRGVRLHGFGVKITGLIRSADALTSSDSMAWSAGARYESPLPGCRHRHCANCPRYALLWRERVLAAITAGSAAVRQHAFAF